MALSLSNAVSNLNKAVSSLNKAGTSFAPTISGQVDPANAGVTRLAPSFDNRGLSAENPYGADLVSQFTGGPTSVGSTFAPSSSDPFRQLPGASLPSDRGPDPRGGINDAKVAMGAKVPDTFRGFENNPLNPRGSALPGGGLVPEGRTQPSVTNPWGPGLLGADSGGFTDMYGNPTDARGGLPNGGVVPDGRASPADAITPQGFSPVITSTGSQYRQAGSPVMGNLQYSTSMQANEPLFAPTSDPFAGQPAGSMAPAPSFSPFTGQPTLGRQNPPVAPQPLPGTTNPLIPATYSTAGATF